MCELNPRRMSCEGAAQPTPNTTTNKRSKAAESVCKKVKIEFEEKSPTGAATSINAIANDKNKSSMKLENEANVMECFTVNIIHPNVLNCPICLTPFRPPLFQCINGHLACSLCCKNKLKSKCPTCSSSIGIIRCSALEAIVNAMRIKCCYASFGCPLTIPYLQKTYHEEDCYYAPFTCPISNCSFKCPSEELYGHIIKYHSSTETTSFACDKWFEVPLRREELFRVLYTDHDGVFSVVFLLLNGNNVGGGRCFSMACLKRAFQWPWPSSFENQITVKGRGGNLHLNSKPTNIMKWNGEYPSIGFLYVPDEEIDAANGAINLRIRFRMTKNG